MARNRRVLIDRIDPAGREPAQATACRQDLPSAERLLAALSTVPSA